MLRRELSHLPTGAVLGGSVSYGRFYNVTGAAAEFGAKSSDTDLLLVLPDYEKLSEVARCLRRVPGLDGASLERLTERAATFATIRAEHPPCIFSHKLKFWVGTGDPILADTGVSPEYRMSVHVFPLSDFDFMTLKDIPILEPNPASGTFDRIIYDYRDSEPVGSSAYHNRSFSGISLGTNPLNPVEVERGSVATVQVCLIRDNRYCPGLHQNLILPQFEKRWESEIVRLYLRLLTFRWKILERLRTEKTDRPFEEQKLSLSHIRYFVFSPHITRRADRD